MRTKGRMKTYPIKRDDGTVMAFEVTSSWVFFSPLFRILESVDGVTDVARQYRNDDRFAFRFQGDRFVVSGIRPNGLATSGALTIPPRSGRKYPYLGVIFAVTGSEGFVER